MSESSPHSQGVLPTGSRTVLRFTVLLGGVLLASAAVGCASNTWKREVIYTYGGVTLYREYVPEGEVAAAGPYVHPVDLDEEPLKSVLSGLLYVEEYFLGLKNPKTLKVFTAEEVGRLVPPLRLAMKDVRPEERIRFLVSRSNWSELFTGPSGTAGVVFQTAPGVLNVAIDYLNEKLLGAEEGQPSLIVFRTDPVEYTSGTPLVPPSGSRLHPSETGVGNPRWLEIDLTAVAKESATREPEGSTPPTARVAEESVPSSEGARTPEEEERYQATRRRVQMLKRLRGDGILSEEEYERELQRVLSGEVQ